MATVERKRCSYMYDPLPKDISKFGIGETTTKSDQESPDIFIDEFLKSLVEKKKVDNGLLLEVRNQVLVMSATSRGKRPARRKPLKNKLTAKMKKKMKLFEIPKEEQKYDLYLSIHQLWKGYIRDLLRGASNLSTMNNKLTKADFHGCLLTVSQSKCPTYVGISGIVVQETHNTLKLICKDDRLRSVPKAGSIFTFTLDQVEFSLYGNHIKFRPSDRATRKFKERSTIEL